MKLWTERNWWRLSPFWSRNRARESQLSLLRLLELISQPGTDCDSATAADWIVGLAHEERFFVRRRLNTLAQYVRQGASLVDAVEWTPEVLDDSDLLALRLASQSGTLPQVIPQLLARHESEREDWRSERRQTIAYFVLLAFIFSLLLLFLSGLIAPTFREMFEEFGMRPLWAFQTFDTYAGSLAANILTALLGWYVLVFILRQVGVTRWARRQLASRFSLGIRSQRSAHLLRLLSGTVTAGRPVEGALSTLARYHFDSRMRNQLLHARNEVEQGFTIEESLRNARLIDQQDAAALSMAKQGQFKGWLLGKIADRIESGVQHRAKVWTALLHPALICCFAAIVLWAALATFGILVQLISSLS